MKKVASFLILLAVLLLNFSCKKTKEEVDEITEFDINYSTSISVPSNTLSLNVPVDFTTPDVSTGSASKLTEYKTTQGLVEYIKLTKFDLSVASGNLDFLKTISIYIKALGVSETLVAQKTVVPTGLSALSLDLQDVNIKNYIFQPNVQFRVNLTIDASTLNGQVLAMDNTVHVKATILK